MVWGGFQPLVNLFDISCFPKKFQVGPKKAQLGRKMGQDGLQKGPTWPKMHQEQDEPKFVLENRGPKLILFW